MVKPATAPTTTKKDVDPDTKTKSTKGKSDVNDADLPPGIDNITDEAVKPDPTSGHSEDPNFYKDQHDLWRWRVLGGGGEVITSADRGFDTREEAAKDMADAKKDGRIIDLIEFQGKSGNGFTTTENLHQS